MNEEPLSAVGDIVFGGAGGARSFAEGIRLAAIEDIEVGSGLMVRREVAGTGDNIVLIKDFDGAVYALDDTCTHSLASLSKGVVRDGYVECRLHAARFDLRSGRELTSSALPDTKTHRVEVRNGGVYLLPDGAGGC